MKPELIVMLTHHDKTVKDAHELFLDMQDAPVKYWGFKDVGLPHEEMKALVRAMKQAGKTTFLEVVSLTEEDGLTGARVAFEGGFDILMGTVYFDSIHDYLRDKPVKYYPFPGHVHSHPSILEGTIEGIVEHCRWLEGKGAHGLDLLTYRYAGDARRLLKEAAGAVKIPLVSAGSIADYRRIAEVWDANAWGFTIGSAFFDAAFIPGGSFKANVLAVSDWLEETNEVSMRRFLE